FQQNTWATISGTKATYIEGLICPSRSLSTSNAPTTYVVNAGMRDRIPALANGAYMDYQANGVFFDWYSPKVFNATNAPNRAPLVTTDLGYMSQHDGSKLTLMLSEN